MTHIAEVAEGMPKNRRFFVYIMTNGPRSHVLYTGVTGDLPHRVFQHKNKIVAGFTSRYNLTRLVYYEEFVYPDAPIAREKEIKGWRRNKKIRLIESMNPQWRDLAEEWRDIYKPDAAAPNPQRVAPQASFLPPPENLLRSERRFPRGTD